MTIKRIDIFEYTTSSTIGAVLLGARTEAPHSCPGPSGGGGPNFIFLPEFLFILVRSPCKNLKPYDNPFCEFSNGGEKSKKINYQK